MLGHPVRIRVLELLQDGPMPVREMLAEIGIEPSSLSQQLAVLRRSGIVTATREGATVVYALARRRRGGAARGGPAHPGAGADGTGRTADGTARRREPGGIRSVDDDEWRRAVTNGGAADRPTTPRPPVPRDLGAGSEEYKERWVAWRVLVYVVVGHFLAGFIWLLFYLGAHAK
ncbi:hypothetical protein GCM10020000_71650 [Streptomyces olivoverticillatus]